MLLSSPFATRSSSTAGGALIVGVFRQYRVVTAGVADQFRYFGFFHNKEKSPSELRDRRKATNESRLPYYSISLLGRQTIF